VGGGASGRFDIDADSRSHFAWLRTRLSLERTLMAWVRTAVSLIAFGFTIFQFFEWMRKTQGIEPAAHSYVPRYLGITLLVTGVVTLIVSAWQYRKFVRYLWSPEFSGIAGIDRMRMHSPLFGVTILLIVVGIVALGAVILRLN
jgi:putative membrane protein